MLGDRLAEIAAVQAELETFLAQYSDDIDDQGRRAVVRNGFQPQRKLLTGLGEVDIQLPKTRDRAGKGRHFRSHILPPYIKRSQSVDSVLPWLYLKGISTGDMAEAVAALLGEDAPGLSPGTLSRLKQSWLDDYKTWYQRDASKQYVYIWCDGIYFNVRGDDAKQCILVVIGATEQGHKEFLAIQDGYREFEQSWTELLVDMKRRGFSAPKLAIGDGALGFWKALAKVFEATRVQRCWVHKTKNILNYMPKSIHGKAKQLLHQIYMTDSLDEAEKAFDAFIEMYQAKYPKAPWSTTGLLSREGLATTTRIQETRVKFIDGIDEKTIEQQRNAA